MTKSMIDHLQIRMQNIDATLQALNSFKVNGENNLSTVFALIQYWKDELAVVRGEVSAHNERIRKLLEQAEGGGNKNDGAAETTGTGRETGKDARSEDPKGN